MKCLAKYCLLTISLTLFITCKKYPEGGFLYRGDKRAINREWKLVKYEVNGIDSTDLINFNGNDAYKNIDFLVTDKTSGQLSLNINGLNGVFAVFKNNNTKLFCSSSKSVYASVVNCPPHTNACYKLIFCPELSETEITEWTIDKLTHREFYLRCAIKNNYIIKLRKR